jgi:CHAD domain-containing protein
MVNQYNFLTSRSLNRGTLGAIIGEVFTLEAGPPVRGPLTFYDTFDWRLFRGGFWLAQKNGSLELLDLTTGDTIAQSPVDRLPVFAPDLPAGELKNKISGILDVRALIPLSVVNVETRTFRILDDEQKTIARLHLRKFRAGSGRSRGSRMTLVSIDPVRGYYRQARQLSGVFLKSGLERGLLSDIYTSLLASAGKTPGDYSSKPDYRLEPGMRSDEAARLILRQLLGVIKANEKWIIEDIDSEFLHDYRVSIRRTRSALSQIRGVFPPEDVARFKADFAYLGNLTNALRDLDVYLVKESVYRSMLPETLRGDIDPLFNYLRRKRVQAHQAVVRGLRTQKYARILETWEAFLETSGTSQADTVDPDTPNASLPILNLAKTRIRKRYRLVVKTGEEILESGRNEVLHMLRIECKKLRYLLEFFSSLFATDQVDLLVKQLKRLQDNLGDYNDLSIQQGYLMNISGELPHNSPESARTLLAIGALIGELEARQREVREAFAGTFTEFAAPPNKKIFAELFGRVQSGPTDNDDISPVQQ